MAEFTPGTKVRWNHPTLAAYAGQEFEVLGPGTTPGETRCLWTSAIGTRHEVEAPTAELVPIPPKEAPKQ